MSCANVVKHHDAVPMSLTILGHVYEVRPRKDKRGVDLISDALPFGRLWYRLHGLHQNAFLIAGRRMIRPDVIGVFWSLYSSFSGDSSAIQCPLFSLNQTLHTI
jgi:hypothetical protein